MHVALSSTVQPQRHAGQSVSAVVQECLQAQRCRHLSPRSLAELRLHLEKLAAYCRDRGVTGIGGVNAALLEEFVLSFTPRKSPALIKAVVWSLRCLGAFCSLMGYLPCNPARSLSHPKLSPRRKLPEYLRPGELRTLLETAAQHNSLQEVTVLSLLVTTGLRPAEAARLRRQDIDLGQQCILVRVKGNWYKRTPISTAMADTLQDYLQEYPACDDPLFLNTWGRSIDTRWIQRLVRQAATHAGIRRTITPRILRHTFATWLADRHGKQITRAMLGHAVGTSTDVYMHLIPSVYQRFMNRHPYQTTLRKGGRL